MFLHCYSQSEISMIKVSKLLILHNHGDPWFRCHIYICDWWGEWEIFFSRFPWKCDCKFSNSLLPYSEDKSVITLFKHPFLPQTVNLVVLEANSTLYDHALCLSGLLVTPNNRIALPKTVLSFLVSHFHRVSHVVQRRVIETTNTFVLLNWGKLSKHYWIFRLFAQVSSKTCCWPLCTFYVCVLNFVTSLLVLLFPPAGVNFDSYAAQPSLLSPDHLTSQQHLTQHSCFHPKTSFLYKTTRHCLRCVFWVS